MKKYREMTVNELVENIKKEIEENKNQVRYFQMLKLFPKENTPNDLYKINNWIEQHENRITKLRHDSYDLTEIAWRYRNY